MIHEDEEDRGKDYVLLASTSKAQLEEARRQLTLLLTELVIGHHNGVHNSSNYSPS